MITKTKLDKITYDVNEALIEVHKILGPGLLESIYHICLKYELDLRKIKYQYFFFLLEIEFSYWRRKI